MIIDKALQLSAGQADVRAAGTYYSQNVIDLGAKGSLQTYEMPAYLIVRVGTAFATGDSLTFSIITCTTPPSDTTDSGTAIAGAVVELSSATIARASLTGDTIVWKVPLPSKLNARYMLVKIVAVASSAFTAGTLDIDITPHVPMDAI